MKVVGKILKVLVALAAIAGVVYVIAAYGERIVAWAKSLLARLQGDEDCFYDDDCCCDEDCCCCEEDCCCEDAAEEADFEA